MLDCFTITGGSRGVRGSAGLQCLPDGPRAVQLTLMSCHAIPTKLTRFKDWTLEVAWKSEWFGGIMPPVAGR